MSDSVCSPRVHALFASRQEARVEQDRLLALVRSQGGPGQRHGAKRADLLSLADCYEFLRMSSSNPAYELGEAARLRKQVEDAGRAK